MSFLSNLTELVSSTNKRLLTMFKALLFYSNTALDLASTFRLLGPRISSVHLPRMREVLETHVRTPGRPDLSSQCSSF